MIRRTALTGVAAIAGCYGDPKPGHERELFLRMQRRDDILSVVVPVLAAAFFFLLLIAIRQRRTGTPAFEGLIGWWRQFMAEARHPLATDDATPEAIEQIAREVEEEADERARRDRKILAEDGTSVLLYVGQRVRVQTADAVHEENLYDVDDEGLLLALPSQLESLEIPWGDVRRIDAQYGPRRRTEFPWMFGLVGAGLLGACGALFNEAGFGIVVGALIGGFIGTLIMSALPGPRWRLVIAVPDPSSPVSLATFASSAAETAATDQEIGKTPREETVARAVIILIVFGMCVLRGWAH